VRQERDRYHTANYTYSKEKEELLQQNTELKVKLDAKVFYSYTTNKGRP
jgi:hypothetical protein